LTTEFVRHDLAKNPTGASEPDRVRVIREGVASYLPDIDPEETPSGWSPSTSCWSARGRRGRAT
jgi:pyruvate dehydrogenase E1 component